MSVAVYEVVPCRWLTLFAVIICNYDPKLAFPLYRESLSLRFILILADHYIPLTLAVRYLVNILNALFEDISLKCKTSEKKNECNYAAFSEINRKYRHGKDLEACPTVKVHKRRP